MLLQMNLCNLQGAEFVFDVDASCELFIQSCFLISAMGKYSSFKLDSRIHLSSIV